MNSIWTETTKFSKRPALLGDLSIDTAIIGGGMAGILTAFLLKQKGIEAIVLEANQIGSGQTKNTTAKITSQHNLIYDTLIQQFGIEKAFQYADANQQAIAQYRRIIQEHGIECEFEERPSYLYSTVKVESLKREVEAALRLGIDATFSTDTTLPFAVKGAAKFQGQAQFHPLKFLKSIAEDLTIYEYTDVITVEDNRIITNGGIVTTKHIVFASHFPFINVPGYYFMRLSQERSYVLALENAATLDGMYLGIDEKGLSFRNSGSLLLLGGGKHRTGENPTGGKYQMLRDAASSYWPECHETAAWSAQDCMPLDSIPYIGQFSASTPDWYVATGFGKWGMTSSMASAMILSDLIAGKESKNAEVFSPHRFAFSASAEEMMENGIESAKGLVSSLFSGPRCTHLGCQLEWNPDESSWDCPCHGSRFDAFGSLIDNPAQENVLKENLPQEEVVNE